MKASEVRYGVTRPIICARDREDIVNVQMPEQSKQGGCGHDAPQFAADEPAPSNDGDICCGVYPSIFNDLVIPQIVSWRSQGIDSALVTLVGVDGSAPRRIGSQLAVTVCGQSIGYISGGCAEKAIIAEAMDAILRGERRTVRYGRGSKFFDIVLPCGSGIDIHIDPLVPTATLSEIDRQLRARKAAELAIDLESAPRIVTKTPEAATVSDLPPVYVKKYWPTPRLLVAGRGVHVDFMARMARELDWKVVIASPDDAVIRRTASLVEQSQHLTRPDDFDSSAVDAYTAVVLLFHDHEWEPAILARCHGSKAFYIGAMGSRRTHELRKSSLSKMGLSESYIASIRGPAGLDIKAATPPEIALSILGEVLACAP